ncbi:MAG: dihydroxyacetone kinase, partial [Spirochaetia bacterium]|nr:dihydroxyacetone kinase [Spirochaetia bacterium]
GKLESADQITVEMLDQIVSDLPFSKGDEVAVLVNGLGATPVDEQYIVVRKINEQLGKLGISVHRFYVGEYATSLEMAGLSISLMKLDAELKTYLDAPAQTPFFVQL